MNKAIPSILLLIFLTGIFRSYLPYVDYFLNKEYIIEFLCIDKEKPESKCNGNCHLNEQLKVASEANNDDDNQKKTRSERNEINYFINNSSINFDVFCQKKTPLIKLLPKWRSTFLNDIFIPPKQFS